MKFRCYFFKRPHARCSGDAVVYFWSKGSNPRSEKDINERTCTFLCEFHQKKVLKHISTRVRDHYKFEKIDDFVARVVEKSFSDNPSPPTTGADGRLVSEKKAIKQAVEDDYAPKED